MPVPMLGATLIKLEMGRECFDVFTYSRKLRKQHCFCFVRDRFAGWLNQEEKSTFYDRHIHSALEAQKRDDEIYFRVIWNESIGNDEYHGFGESFAIPIQVMQEFLEFEDGQKTRCLYVPRPKPMKIITTHVSAIIAEIRKNKQVKRAFIKAVSNWNWHGDTVTLYRDFAPLSFFFQSDSWPANGGLILHEDNLAGMPKRQCYRVHT